MSKRAPKESRKLDVVVMFDVSRALPPEHDFTEEFNAPEKPFETEWDVVRTLRELGHSVRTHPLFDDLAALVNRLGTQRPDIVFNLAESFHFDRANEPNLVGLLELMKLPYTGVGPEGLALCHDKALAKKLLAWHHIRTPKFVLATRKRPLKKLTGLRLPVFVKPVNTESSEGIAQAALCQDEKSALERMAFIFENLKSDALIEEYIDGRELYCGVIGNERLVALPLVELFVGDASVGAEGAPSGAPRFFTYKAKWDEAYRKKWNIHSGPPRELDLVLEKKMKNIARKACGVLRIQGYARVDMRLTASGEIHVIEVNPNPGLAAGDEFASTAARANLPYPRLIERIVNLGLTRVSSSG